MRSRMITKARMAADSLQAGGDTEGNFRAVSFILQLSDEAPELVLMVKSSEVCYTALVSYCCCDELSQVWWLKSTHICLIFLEVSPK